MAGARGKYADWITQEGLLKIEGWARDGLVDEQIAANIGIRRETLYAWKKDHPNISYALKRGKEVVDRQVENALFKRALGYEYEEKTYETRWDDTKECFEENLTKRVTKQVAPDTTAQIFWLKNRKPAEWRDKIEQEVYGKDGGAIRVQNLSEADIDKRIADLSARLKR